MLVVSSKVVKEVSLLNNYYMLRVAHEVSQYLDESLATLESHEEDADVKTYLWQLIYDAKVAMQDILADHYSLTKEFNIYSQSMV